MDDCIRRQAAIDAILHNQEVYSHNFGDDPIDKYTIAIIDNDAQTIAQLPSTEPVIRCKDCKHNPKDEWFGCPMSHLSEAQRPETAWCWKAERRTDG